MPVLNRIAARAAEMTDWRRQRHRRPELTVARPIERAMPLRAA